MKNLTLLALLVAAYSYGQTTEEKEKIVGSYDAKQIQGLIAEFEQNENNRVARVNSYLQAHPALKKSHYSGNVLYDMFDIVDNKPIYRCTDNVNSARASGTNQLHNGGTLGLNIEGQNMTVGVWDGGWALRSHVEFANDATPAVSRVSLGDTVIPNPQTNDHGTHVTGTIGAKGVNPAAKGMAPKVFVRSFQWDNDLAEVTTAAGTTGLLISNHSYGVPTFDDEGDLNVPPWMPGCYKNDTRAWDLLAVSMPYYLQVCSAGNNGSGSYTGALAANFDKLIGEKVAKNNLVIANAAPTVNPVTGNVNILAINGSSSQGPADDLRVKPDIAADGSAVLSTINTNTSAYATYTGTSMASPTTAGSLILLQQYYNSLRGTFMRSATLKGLVCHTAHDDNGTPGPDPKFGWGLLRTDAAARVITAANNNTAIIMESTLVSGQTYTMNFSAAESANLKASISWTDPAGVDRSGQQNSAVPALINDLDLRIANGSTTYLPWKLQQITHPTNPFQAVKADNVVDNIEVVAAEAGTSGDFTLTVTHKGTLSGGAQNFSLILTGTNLTLGTVKNNIKDVAVWPNPARDVLNVQFESAYENVNMSLWDMYGRTVYQKNLGTTDNAAYQISTANLSKGMYILNIESGGLTYSKKIVVE